MTLDDDIAELARRIAGERRLPMKQIVNEALRTGLREMARPPKLTRFRVRPYHMGLQPGISLDNIHELLSQIEGEGSR